MPKSKLTAQDIILIQKQFDAVQHLNDLLSEAVAEIGEVVRGVKPDSFQDREAAVALARIESTIAILEKRVEEFTRSLKQVDQG